MQEEYTGDLNITIQPSNTIIIENNFNVTLPDEGGVGGGNGLNQDGGSGNTEINNTLVDPVLIKIYNMSNTFIYFSNGTIFQFQDGDLNITLNGGEYFYIIDFNGLYWFNEKTGTIVYDLSENSNDGTIFGATWGISHSPISSGNYTQSGCSLIATDDSNFIGQDWKVTYTYSYSEDTAASDASGNLIVSLSSGSAWVMILIVVGFATVVFGILTSGLGRTTEPESAYKY